jgi:hypothetical protein
VIFDSKIVADSLAPNGKRLATFQLRYPRFIHAEFMTHRVFGRCASSSRAIPVQKMIAITLAEPAFFVHVGKNQPGMQANEEVSPDVREQFRIEWEELAAISARYVRRWSEQYGIHKQVANRALEPWQHISVVATTTEFDNFWDLRCHKAAQPEFQRLASNMRSAFDASVPVERPRNRLHESGWHLPYVTDDERRRHADNPFYLAKLSTARCARVSYLNHDGTEPSVTKDLELFEQLLVSRPMHASPAEHQGYPAAQADSWSGNLRGWSQHRKWLENAAATA